MSMEVNFFTREEENDEEEYEMHGQALPVQPFNIKNVDERAVPLTSQEYLQQVIAQRAKLPAIVTASVPKLEKKNSKNIEDLFKEDHRTHSEHSPSQEWQQTQVSDFSDLRYRIECNRETWEQKCSKKLPSDQNEWFQFMFGGNEDSKIAPQQPFLNIVLSLNNEMIEKLIKFVVVSVTEKKISVYKAGLWFFALLACIDVPLRIKMMKQLRIFAQVCRNLRNEIDLSNEESKRELMAQNLFICLIGRYFGQRDLSD